MDGLKIGAEELPHKPLVQVLKSEKFGDDNSMLNGDSDDNDPDLISQIQDGKSEALSLKLADSDLST